MILILAVSCGLIVANLYYAQPLVGIIAPSIALSPASSGLIVTLTQIGYGLGLLLVVPLGDLIENKKLVTFLVSCSILSLLLAAMATGETVFLGSAFLIGIGSVAVQVLVPYAAHLSSEATRGRAVGDVMSGLMAGIMLSRPVSSAVAALGSWHLIFYISAGIMLGIVALLWVKLPSRAPASGMSYGGLLASMGRIVIETPLLRRRALYHAALFAGFSLFWTVVPLVLAGAPYGLTQRGIALFALAGAAGVFAAPIAGRVADRGWVYPATGIAMLGVIASFLIAIFVAPATDYTVYVLTGAAIALDFCVTTNLVLGQRSLFLLPAQIRSRINGIYMATFFFGGAAGSALGAMVYYHFGWIFAGGMGAAIAALALLYYATERKS